MEGTVGIVTHFLTSLIRLVRRLPFCRLLNVGSNGTNFAENIGRSTPKSRKNGSEKRTLQSLMWPS